MHLHNIKEIVRLSTTKQPTIRSEEVAPGVFACTKGSVWEKCNVLKYAIAFFPNVDIQFIFSTEIEDDEE